MDKSAVLKARVTEEVHTDFVSVCAAMGRTPAAVLRELVETYVATHGLALEDDVRITIEQPHDYDYGAWRCRMTLRAPEAMDIGGGPLPFRMPELASRRIHPDKGFRVAASGWNGEGSGLDGIFVDGVWEGHVYSNGVAEADNKTSLDDVLAALKASVRERVLFARDQTE